MGRRDIQRTLVFSGKVINTNGRTQLGTDLPLSNGWYRAMLTIKCAVTIGTGTGAITNGELDIIKNVLIKTDRGETLCDLPGRALYNIANVLKSTAPRKDAIAAASATYRVTLPIFFADPTMLRPEDTILDTSRYNSIKLEVHYGTVADLFTSVGTSSIAVTADLEIVETDDVLPNEAKPISYISYETQPVADPNSVTTINLDRDVNLSYKRAFIHTGSSADAGSPFTGTNDDGVIDTLSLLDQSGFIVKDADYDGLQDDNKTEYSLESVISGLVVLDFVQDKSHQSALWTGNLSKLQLTWDNDAAVAANDQVSVVTESIRKLIA